MLLPFLNKIATPLLLLAPWENKILKDLNLTFKLVRQVLIQIPRGVNSILVPNSAKSLC